MVSIELSIDAIREFAATQLGPPETRIHLAGADLMALPFPSASFNVVLVAFHGMDYMTDPAVRKQGLREIERVLQPGGSAIIDSYNPIGLIRSRAMWQVPQLRKRMLNYLLKGEFLRSTFIDLTGLELHQAVPQLVIREVAGATSLRHEATFDSDGKSVSITQAAIRSPEPYFIFRKPK